VYNIFYKICILVCKNEQEFFNREERIALLLLAFQNMVYLGRVISMDVIRQLAEDVKSIELIIVTALSLNDQELLNINQLLNVHKRIKAQEGSIGKIKKPS